MANSVVARTSAAPWAQSLPVTPLWEEFYRNTPYTNGPGYGGQYFDGSYGQFPGSNGRYNPARYEQPYPEQSPGRYPTQSYRDLQMESFPLQEFRMPNRESNNVQSLRGQQPFAGTSNNNRPIPS